MMLQQRRLHSACVTSPRDVCKGGDTLAAIAAVTAARNSCTQRNSGMKAAMSAVC